MFRIVLRKCSPSSKLIVSRPRSPRWCNTQDWARSEGGRLKRYSSSDDTQLLEIFLAFMDGSPGQISEIGGRTSLCDGEVCFLSTAWIAKGRRIRVKLRLVILRMFRHGLRRGDNVIWHSSMETSQILIYFYLSITRWTIGTKEVALKTSPNLEPKKHPLKTNYITIIHPPHEASKTPEAKAKLRNIIFQTLSICGRIIIDSGNRTNWWASTTLRSLRNIKRKSSRSTCLLGRIDNCGKGWSR